MASLNKRLPTGIAIGCIANLMFFVVIHANNGRAEAAQHQLLKLQHHSQQVQIDIERLDAYQVAFDQLLNYHRSVAQNRLYWQTLFDTQDANVDPLILERRERVEAQQNRFSPVFGNDDSGQLTAIELYSTALSFGVSHTDEASAIDFLYRLTVEQGTPVNMERCALSLNTSDTTSHSLISDREIPADHSGERQVQLRCDARYYELQKSA